MKGRQTDTLRDRKRERERYKQREKNVNNHKMIYWKKNFNYETMLEKFTMKSSNIGNKES